MPGFSRRNRCRTRRANAGRRGPGWRCHSYDCGYLPAHAIKGAVPLKVSPAHPLHYDVLARRDGRRIPYGLAPRNLLSGLLLASFRCSLSARHEYWSDGSCHSHHTSRENAALAPAHASRRGCRACALRCAGDCVIATPSHRQERSQRGDARRNAYDDAREWQRTCHEVAGLRNWHLADIARLHRTCPLLGVKRTLACTSFDTGLAVFDTPYQGAPPARPMAPRWLRVR